MKNFSIQLTLEQWQVIGDALGDLPFKKSALLIAELNKQINDQNKPAEPELAEAAE